MSFPPSAITVESGLDVTSGMQDGIPSLDLSKVFEVGSLCLASPKERERKSNIKQKWGDNETTSWLNSFASLSKRPYQPYIFPFLSGSQNYFNTKKTLEDLATRTMLKGCVNEMPSPCGLNCTYTLHFDGPLLSCNQSSKNITDSTPTDFTIPVFWANWTTTEGAVNVSTPYSFQLTSIQMGPQDFRSKFSAYKGKPYYGSPELDLFRYTKDEMTCYPRRAEYEVIQSFENGQPTSTTKIGQVHELVPIEDGVRFPEGANTSNWEEMTNSSAVTAYARDANILTLILAMANPLAGSFRTTISPGSVLYDEVLQDDQGRAFLRVSNFLGWNGQRNRTLVDLTPLFIGYNTPTLIPDISKLQFWSGANNIATTSLFHFDEKLMNDMLINVTLSTIAQYNLWGTSANVTRTQSRPQYSFSNPVNILVPYFVSLAVVLPLVTAGFWSLVKNGVPATDHGFLQILMTTRGSRELDHLAAGGCLGGDQNIPPALKKHEVMFGELVGQGSQLPHGWEGEDSSRTRLMAGFGSKDEVVPLRKGEDYGHLNT